VAHGHNFSSQPPPPCSPSACHHIPHTKYQNNFWCKTLRRLIANTGTLDSWHNNPTRSVWIRPNSSSIDNTVSRSVRVQHLEKEEFLKQRWDWVKMISPATSHDALKWFLTTYKQNTSGCTISQNCFSKSGKWGTQCTLAHIPLYYYMVYTRYLYLGIILWYSGQQWHWVPHLTDYQLSGLPSHEEYFSKPKWKLGTQKLPSWGLRNSTAQYYFLERQTSCTLFDSKWDLRET
jgi:hypothetical protein